MFVSRNCRRSPCLVALLAVVAAFGLASADTGKWTPKSNWSEGNQERYAVHMMLLRGDYSPYHSRILWWQGEAQIAPSTQTILYGGEWGWTPDNDSCASYPTSNFARIGIDTCGMDPFCGSHTILGDGRVLMSSGHNPFIMDYGDNRVRIFTDGLATSKGAWSDADTMSSWRWYPTATTLRDGRALLTSGNQYRQHQIFGGKRSGATPAKPAGDSLYRFAPIPGGKWDAAILPVAAPGNLRPTVRYAHSAIAAENVRPFYGQVCFAGHDSTGLMNDTWIQNIYYYNTDLAGDPQYAWQKPTIIGGPPAQRSDHSAIVALDTNMVVFGGLDSTNSGRSDVWRLFLDSGTPPSTFRWSSIAATDTIPPARFGHSAIYDVTIRGVGDTLRRMIVFGGTSAVNQAPSDSRVWELRFLPGRTDSATWHVMPQDTLGANGSPGPRFWHTMNVDRNERVHPGTSGTCHVAFMFGGKRDTGACSDTLWKLWIFKSGHVGWERVASPDSMVPGRRARHSAVLDTLQSGYGGRLYVYGGVKADSTPTDSRVYVIDPWGGKYATWTPWHDMGVSLAGHTALLDNEQQVARTAEVYDAGTNLWTALSSATMRQQTYPPVFVVPGGSGGASRVITINNNTTATYFLDVAASGPSGAWQPLANGSLDCLPQAAVLYRPNRLMVAGGLNGGAATGKTRTLDASSLSSQWVTAGADMVPRLNPNLVLLPTGNVLAVGGNQENDSDLEIRRPQMWTFSTDSTGAWSDTSNTTTRLAAQPTIRGYHSTAILLPDGRILSAGGSDNQGDTLSDQHTANLFCPPYLFKANGTTPATRPVINAAPDSVAWASTGTYTILVADTTGVRSGKVSLIRSGATTHAFDQNQRYVPTTFTIATGPNRLLVNAPADASTAPPGDYMLFVTGSTDGSDVPAVARWVRVTSAGQDTADTIAPATVSDLTADCDPDTPNGWIITWTAPADDGTLSASGRARAFDMRRKSTSINDGSWSSATQMIPPTPGAPGTQHTMYVTVSASTYIRLKSVDDANHLTVLSNQVLIFPWTTEEVDCPGGEGMFAGGGGGGGSSLRRMAGSTSVHQAGASSILGFENSVLNGVARNEHGVDTYRLEGSASGLHLRVPAGHAVGLDAARLVAVDHVAGHIPYSVGGEIVLGSRSRASHVEAGDGTDVLASFAGGGTYALGIGDTLAVTLGSGSSPVVIEGSGSGSIGLQVPNGAGGWQAAQTCSPRTGTDELTFSAPGSEQIRLLSNGNLNLSFIGSLAAATDTAVTHQGTMVSAISAKLGDVASDLTSVDLQRATIVGPDTVMLAYSLPELAAGQTRDLFLVVDGTPLNAETVAPSSLQPQGKVLPTRFALRQNQPNPLRAATTIRFDMPVGAMVLLEVFDTQGRRVETLANGYFPAGYQSVIWNPGTGGHHAGVYFYRLEAGAFRDRKKMVLLAR